MTDNEEKVVVKDFPKEKFQFVHKDGYEKIHDEKFKTKSTTFFKDSLKRFAKNKSSVAGAIIIAVLLLSSLFVPVFSPHNTTETQLLETYTLPAKLFKAGTGWWDGTIELEASAYYDEHYERIMPNISGSNNNNLRAVLQDTIVEHDTVYYDQALEQCYGGKLITVARTKEADTGTNFFYIRNYDPIKIKDTDNTKVQVVLPNDPNAREGAIQGEYRVRLSLSNSKYGSPKYVVLQDWSKDYDHPASNPLEFDLSQAVVDSGATEYSYCSLVFDVKKDANAFTFFTIENIYFSTTNEEYQEELDEHSIYDANHTALLDIDSKGMWVSTGNIDAYETRYSKVSFKYDMYEGNLGFADNFIIGESLLNEYIAKGWCTYDWTVGPSSFQRLSDKCPIVEDDDGVYVKSQSVSMYEGIEVKQITCSVQKYLYYGFEKMPKYILGTDGVGRDCFTHSLRCLKNSIFISILCCAVTITIGLIWGSISGYYGGRIDLIMERITDILVGIPGTVVLTLVLLLMGRNLGTFAFAVCLTGWIGTASLTRTQMYRFKNRESVLASRTLGANDARLIFRHILPNSLGTIVTSSVLKIPGFIFTEASLAFLHLGLDSGDSFGVILSENQQFLSTRPMLIFFPTLLLCLLMICFNLFGNGLRDALNPTLKGGEQ